jgi:hypothetical protein
MYRVPCFNVLAQLHVWLLACDVRLGSMGTLWHCRLEWKAKHIIEESRFKLGQMTVGK